jgi:hypothetical protein
VGAVKGWMGWGGGGGGGGGNFGFYVLVERFVGKRMDGSLVLTYHI